jgi:hypothetical protein
MEKQVNYKEDFTLSKYWNQVCRAHDNVSFSPEKRADYIVKAYSEELDEDLKDLGEKAGNYKEKYETRFMAWIGAKSRCISSMITGPANFPVRRAEKANNSEHNRYEDFRKWRDKYFSAVKRVKTPSPEDDLEAINRKLDEAIIRNENIKEWNKVIRSHKAGKIEYGPMMEQLSELGMDDKVKQFFPNSLKYDHWNGFGTIAPEIKRLRERATALQRRIERKADWEDINFDGGYITIEDDRVKIYHDSKPEQDTITDLKRNGFRWSRHWGCWCRKHTGAALSAAKRITKAN